MSFNNNWSRWLRRILDLAPDASANIIEFLRQRYVEEAQRIARFERHAERMHYSQDRESFCQMARETRSDADRIGEKIVARGGGLPAVEQCRSTEENSWQSLSKALDEENRSADRLPEQLRRIESEYPDVADFLQQISRTRESQRRRIQHMLMRNDPFAHSLA